MSMGRLRKFFDIQHHQGRIGYRFRQNTFGIILKTLRTEYRNLNPDPLWYRKCPFFHGHCDEVKGSSIHSRRKDNMIPRLTDIKYGIIVSRLSG